MNLNKILNIRMHNFNFFPFKIVDGTLATYVKRDPIIKLDQAEIGKYLQLLKCAPTETVSKPPKESSQEVSQKWFFNYTLNIYCLHVLDPF